MQGIDLRKLFYHYDVCKIPEPVWLYRKSYEVPFTPEPAHVPEEEHQKTDHSVDKWAANTKPSSASQHRYSLNRHVPRC